MKAKRTQHQVLDERPDPSIEGEGLECNALLCLAFANYVKVFDSGASSKRIDLAS